MTKAVDVSVTVDDGVVVELEVVECPSCLGAIGVDVSYLEQVDTVIECPYCRNPISFGDCDDQQDN